MYKSVPSDLKKIKLNTDLYQLHKDGSGRSDFGMDNTSALLDQGFGLYSTTNVKGKIGPVKTEYFQISLKNDLLHILSSLNSLTPAAASWRPPRPLWRG